MFGSHRGKTIGRWSLAALCAAWALVTGLTCAWGQQEPDTTALLQQGDAAVASGDLSQAEGFYLKALAQRPRLWPVYRVVADFYAVAQRDCARAIPYYEVYFEHAAVPGGEGHMEALDNALMCHVKIENWDRAIEIAEASWRLMRDRSAHAQARIMLRRRGELELRAGRYEKALATFQKVLLDDFGDVHAQLMRAHTRYYLGQYDKALEEYRYIQRSFERGQLAFVNLYIGTVLTMLERHGEALEALRMSVEVDGEHPQTYWWMARCHQETGNNFMAERAYRRSLELSRLVADTELLNSTRNNLAWLIILRSRPGAPELLEALSLVRQAVEDTRGQEATYCDTMAEVHLRLGNHDRALRWSQQALRLSPGDPYLQKQVRRIERYSQGFESPGGRVRLERWREP